MTARRSIIKHFIEYLAPYRFLVILCIFLQLGIAFLSIFQLHLLRTAIDAYVLRQNFSGLIRGVVLIYLFAICSLLFFTFLRMYLTRYIGQNVMSNLRLKIFSHLQRMALSFFDKNPIGELMAVATNDVSSLERLVTEGITNILGSILLFLGITGYLFYQNYELTLMISVFVFLFGFCSLLANRKIRETVRQTRSWFGQISSFLQESITGISLIKIFHQEKRQSDRLYYLNKGYTDVSRRALYYHQLPTSITTLAKAGIMCSILWYGGREVLRGDLSLGSLLVFIGSLSLFFGTIGKLADANRIIQAAIASLEKIFKLLDIKGEIESPQGKVELTGIKEKVEFKDVWFAYDNDNFVLENFNLEIQKGQQIGIVGHTGAGKTTIINLLARFYEINKGEILIDGINIKNIQKSQLRSLIGIIPQEPFLFSGSIEDNMNLGNSKIDGEQVRRAATYVGAHKFISRLPNGYKENVYETGAKLSTGQKQLISFARACVFNPQIIVLDEATANVDAETTAGIRNTLKRIKRKRTSVIIAHHLSTVTDADKIVVLHKGRIREIGTHRELMERQGLYHTLYQLQGVKDTLATIIE